ncbi:TadE/TadG family type IV pilus assembly protein [Terriglobus roseus]|uniref:TadE-like protein n=1 Tax=Terriglobus roseus TaxID=392734 RepID=A0A1G7PCA3_9BACT|nr:TadE-like protein [Terriglobus roseus]
MRHVKHLRAGEVLCEETGSTLLETSLCLSLVLLVILGIMECSLAVYTEHYVEWAASAGARYATVRGSTYSGTMCATSNSNYCEAGASDIQNYIRTNVAPGISASNISVTASWPGTSGASGACDTAQGSNSPGCMVTVTVSYPFTFMLPAPLNKGITLSASRSTIISQ